MLPRELGSIAGNCLAMPQRGLLEGLLGRRIGRACIPLQRRMRGCSSRRRVGTRLRVGAPSGTVLAQHGRDGLVNIVPSRRGARRSWQRSHPSRGGTPVSALAVASRGPGRAVAQFHASAYVPAAKETGRNRGQVRRPSRVGGRAFVPCSLRRLLVLARALALRALSQDGGAPAGQHSAGARLLAVLRLIRGAPGEGIAFLHGFHWHAPCPALLLHILQADGGLPQLGRLPSGIGACHSAARPLPPRGLLPGADSRRGCPGRLSLLLLRGRERRGERLPRSRHPRLRRAELRPLVVARHLTHLAVKCPPSGLVHELRVAMQRICCLQALSLIQLALLPEPLPTLCSLLPDLKPGGAHDDGAVERPVRLLGGAAQAHDLLGLRAEGRQDCGEAAWQRAGPAARRRRAAIPHRIHDATAMLNPLAH
mmetsp:Transcript_14620/g.34708  ORF Transcript_14620/g.34708 Transcript_14620/m.34708 type:complete len:424 (-) Transcript_14620:1552-2823(-)